MIRGVKRNIKKSLAVLTAMCICIGMGSSQTAVADKSSYEQAIDEYQQNLDSLKEQQKQLDDKLSKVKQNKLDEEKNQKLIESQITVVEKTLKELDGSISELDKKIDGLYKDIEKTQKNIDSQQKEIDTGIDRFKKRLRALYLAGGSESYTDIILGSQDFYDMLMKLELVKRVASHDNDLITELIELKTQYEGSLKALQTQSDECKKSEEELLKQQEEQKSQKTKLDDLYSKSVANQKKLEEDEKNFAGQSDEINKEQQEAEETLANLYATLEAIENKTSTNNGDYGYVEKTSFTWPCPGFYHISYGFGPRWGTMHQGIDIYSSDIQGANVIASDSGTVILKSFTCTHNYGKSESCGCGGGYGNYVIIDHGDGFWTLYGHMQDIYVEEGDYLEKGQVLGAVGSTGFSTGFHLHFEVRYENVPYDPLNYV